MRKITIIISTSVAMMFMLASCFEEIENWYTNTSNYDGRYDVGITCEEDEDYNTVIRDGIQLMIYNSAANVADEIIIETNVAVVINEYKDGDFTIRELVDEGYHVKGKFKITGNSSSFKGSGAVWNLYSNPNLAAGEYLIIFAGRYYWYTNTFFDDGDVGEEFEAIHLYSRLSMEESKITPMGATTIGGNKSDGLNMKITTYCDHLIVESYPTSQDTWADPNVPEYAWRVKEGSRKNADGWEEHWTFTGYRYTGYPEDDPNILPPIIPQ